MFFFDTQCIQALSKLFDWSKSKVVVLWIVVNIASFSSVLCHWGDLRVVQSRRRRNDYETLHRVLRNRQEAEKDISPGSLMWRLLLRAWQESWLVINS